MLYNIQILFRIYIKRVSLTYYIIYYIVDIPIKYIYNIQN